MSRQLHRLIHAGCRELGIDTATRHGLQLVTTGKESLSEMSEAELRKVVDALKARGFRPAPGSGRKPAAKRGDVRYAHVLWRLLSEAGVMNVPGRDGLNAFIRSRFAATWGATPLDVDQMTEWGQIADVIDALKAICLRNGIEVKP